MVKAYLMCCFQACKDKLQIFRGDANQTEAGRGKLILYIDWMTAVCKWDS